MAQTAISPSLARFLDATAPAESSTSAAVNSHDPRQPEPEAPQPAPYGYYNTFHSRAQPVLDAPPTYEKSQVIKPRDVPPQFEPLPVYSSSVQLEGILGLKHELSSPFERARRCEWRDVYAVLCGTSLCLYRAKYPKLFSKDRSIRPGRLIRQYTLQHAELGIATDFKKTDPVPKHCLSHVLPQLARQKVYASEPHLFEPAREHVFRVRPEGEQILFCASSQVELLNWVEALCMAVDISAPIEDRAEPRYRSLPRRNRRQRALESQLAENIEQLNELSEGRRFLAEQERLLQTLYPHLAQRSAEAEAQQDNTVQLTNTQNSDPDSEDLDPAEVRPPSPTTPVESSLPVQRNHRLSVSIFDTACLTFPSTVHPANSSMIDLRSSSPIPTPLIESRNIQRASRRASTSSQTSGTSTYLISTTDSTPRKPVPRNRSSQSHMLRYRRRCAPILLSDSPRASEIIIKDGVRVRIVSDKGSYTPFEQLPPRYESHRFPLSAKRIPLPPVDETVNSVTLDVGDVQHANEVLEASLTTNATPIRRPAPVPRNISAYSVSQDSVASSSNLTTPTTESDVELPLAPMDTRDTINSVGPKDSAAEAKERGSPERREGARKMKLLGSMRIGIKRGDKDRKTERRDRIREESDFGIGDGVIWAWGG